MACSSERDGFDGAVSNGGSVAGGNGGDGLTKKQRENRRKAEKAKADRARAEQLKAHRRPKVVDKVDKEAKAGV